MDIICCYCDQALNKLREAEVLLSQGATLAVIWKKIVISDCPYYRWRKECGGMRIEQAHLYTPIF